MRETVAFGLRPLAAGDAARIAALIGDWEVARRLSSPPYPYALDDARAFVERIGAASPPERHLAIEIDGQFAGAIGIDQRTGGYNLGYWLGRPYWGRRVMSGAAQRITADFFAKSSESHLMSGYFSGNEASWAIQRRLGFEFVEEGSLFNRPHGQRLSHVVTRLTRARLEAGDGARARV